MSAQRDYNALRNINLNILSSSNFVESHQLIYNLLQENAFHSATRKSFVDDQAMRIYRMNIKYRKE